ncbi:MAG TPA: hypothetical protein VN711_02950 [Candidatus Saccharimonadales bacterium]|nr:hypothetical protein [Candidatus Saccharimonadales bacterium]
MQDRSSYAEPGDSLGDIPVEALPVFKQFRANVERLLQENPQNTILKMLALISTHYIQTHGFALCNDIAKDLAKRFMTGEHFPESSIHIWYGETKEGFTGHAVAMIRHGSREYYVDPLGYRPFQLPPGITVIDRAVSPSPTYAPSSHGELVTPSLRRTDPQMATGRPSHNEIRVH